LSRYDNMPSTAPPNRRSMIPTTRTNPSVNLWRIRQRLTTTEPPYRRAEGERGGNLYHKVACKWRAIGPLGWGTGVTSVIDRDSRMRSQSQSIESGHFAHITPRADQ